MGGLILPHTLHKFLGAAKKLYGVNDIGRLHGSCARPNRWQYGESVPWCYWNGPPSTRARGEEGRYVATAYLGNRAGSSAVRPQRIHVMLRREGWRVNHKKVYRNLHGRKAGGAHPAAEEAGQS